MKLVKPNDHKFAALHGAVWSGGSFVYVPKGVSVEIPLQSYFRLNAPGAGQFEHTLIIVDEGADLHFIEGCSAPKYNVANLHAGCVELFVGKNARLRYSTIENWSKNMYNLNTKRALVEEGGTIEWVSGSFGSHVSYLYPMSILKGKGAKMEFTGITLSLIHILNKAAVATERMKKAYVMTKDKAEHSTNASENSAEEYASDKIEAATDRTVHETARCV